MSLSQCEAIYAWWKQDITDTLHMSFLQCEVICVWWKQDITDTLHMAFLQCEVICVWWKQDITDTLQQIIFTMWGHMCLVETGHYHNVRSYVYGGNRTLQTPCTWHVWGSTIGKKLGISCAGYDESKFWKEPAYDDDALTANVIKIRNIKEINW